MSSIKFIVTNNSTFVEGRIPRDLYQAFKKTLGYTPEDAAFRIKNAKYGNNWDGSISTVCYSSAFCKCPNKKSGMHFPTGLLSLARKFCKDNNISYSLFDSRKKLNSTLQLSMSDEFEIRDYQIKIVDDAVARGRGIIKVATGGGKSGIAANIIQRLAVSPTIFYVTSLDLLKQAKDELSRFIVDNNMPLEVGAIGGGKCDIKDINVMTVQTAVRCLGKKYKNFDDEGELGEGYSTQDIDDIENSNKEAIKDLITSAKLIICDECITGDSIVETKDGRIQMKDLDKHIGKEVLSFDGNNVVWKKITHFYKKGRKQIIRVKLSNKKAIKCTEDHLIKTKRGWIQAIKLLPSDQVLSCINTVANSYVPVDSIEECGIDEVFDITVEDTHCFFANGLLVHNCQHWAAETCQIISDYSVAARYRFGASATPYRDKGDDLLIEACFGRTIADINASFLIERGVLVQPTIYFAKIDNMKSLKLPSYQMVYQEAIVNNDIRNQYIANIAKKMADAGRVVLILCRIIEHGNILESMIDGSVFIHGSHSAKVREEHLAKIRNREASITISSSIFDEGIDCRPLDTLILAGSGISQTRALQRIGRVIRTYVYNGIIKENAIIVDFNDECKYLRRHSSKRKMIYYTEPQFIIKEIDG